MYYYAKLPITKKKNYFYLNFYNFTEKSTICHKNENCCEQERHYENQQHHYRSDSTDYQIEPEERNGVNNTLSNNKKQEPNKSRPSSYKDLIIIDDDEDEGKVNGDEENVSKNKSNDSEKDDKKMVPPLRLKKISSKQSIESESISTKDNVAKSSTISPTSSSPTSPCKLIIDESEDKRKRKKSNDPKYRVVAVDERTKENSTQHKESVTSDKELTAASKMTMTNVVAPVAKSCDSMSVVNDYEPKSIEITIPSVPELGIKETRTDRIDLPREISNDKSFVINYFVDE